MTRVVLFFGLFVCAVLQAILPAWAGMGQAKPPLLLGLVLYYALTRDNSLVLESAVLAGLLQDSLSLIPHGMSTLAFLVVAIAANHYRDRVFSENWITHMLIGVASAVAVTLVLYLLLVSGQHRNPPLSFVLRHAFGGAMLGMMTIPLVYKALEGLDGKLGNVELRER